jgi:hypothetical protein
MWIQRTTCPPTSSVLFTFTSSLVLQRLKFRICPPPPRPCSHCPIRNPPSPIQRLHCVPCSSLCIHNDGTEFHSPSLNDFAGEGTRGCMNQYIYRNLRKQQMSVLILLCTSYTTCFGPCWWPSSGGFVIQKKFKGS